MLDAEAEDNSSRPSPRPRTKFWPRGQLVLEDLPSLANKAGARRHAVVFLTHSGRLVRFISQMGRACGLRSI